MGRRSSLSHTPLSHTQALEPLIGRAFGAHLSSAEEKAHGAGVGTAARGWVEFATGVADGTGSTGVTDGGRKSPIVSLESLWDGIETMLLLLQKIWRILWCCTLLRMLGMTGQSCVSIRTRLFVFNRFLESIKP